MAVSEVSGAWGWFRLIDDAQPQRESDLRMALGFQTSGHQAREQYVILNQ